MKHQTLMIVFTAMFATHALAQENSKNVPPISQPVACAEGAMPALLMVEGVNSDPEKFKRYSDALRQAKIYDQLEGYYVTVGDPVELLEGEWPQERFTVVARFPCKERAHQFWHSETYTQLKELRIGAGDVRAMVYQEFAAPDRIKWNKP